MLNQLWYLELNFPKPQQCVCHPVPARRGGLEPHKNTHKACKAQPEIFRLGGGTAVWREKETKQRGSLLIIH